MRYRLTDSFQLCGFDKLPFSIMDKRTKKYSFFNKEQWGMLQRAAYGYVFKDDELDETQAQFLVDFKNAGYIEEVGEGEIVAIPPYRRYKNRYKEAVQWSITGKCNAKCKHCFMSAPDAKMGEPTLEQCLEIIHMLDECGTRRVSITGGEPFVRDDFWQIVDAMLEHDLMLTTLYSNGILVNQELLDGFKKRGMRPSWQISFDGVDGWHDWLRGVDGATDYAIDAIKLLRQNGFSVSCAVSIFKGNISSFSETIELLASLGVFAVKVGYMQQQGEWLKYPEQWLTDEEQLDFYLDYIPRYIQSGRPVNLQCEGLFMGYSDKYLENRARMRNARSGEHEPQGADSCLDDASCAGLCACGDEENRPWEVLLSKRCQKDMEYTIGACEVVSTNYYIGAGGAVLPCMAMEGTPAGSMFPNLFERPLAEILSESYYTQMTDATIGDVNDHNPDCKNCEYRLVCCAGCRVMAIGADGDDYLAIDRRTCMMVKEDWPGKLREAIVKHHRGHGAGDR